MDHSFVMRALGMLSFLILLIIFIFATRLNRRDKYFKSATTGTRCKFYNTSGKKVKGYIISRHKDKVKIHYAGVQYKQNINKTYPV